MFDELFDAFESAGFELFLVGGWVRDYLLGVESQDVDFATSARPEQIIEVLHKNNLKSILIGLEFGTIQTILNDQKVEITTYRCKESYKKGDRKPSVQFGHSIEEDLARRDFKVNAIAMDRNGNLIDPFLGKRSLRTKTLITPIDPEISFTDDPLRMLRACRFSCRGFGIGGETYCAMKKLAEHINFVSKERIFEEVSKILMSDKPSQGLMFMAVSDLLKHVFPELQEMYEFKKDPGKFHYKNVWEHTLQVVDSVPKKLELKWSALYHDVGKPQTYEETESGIHFYQHHQVGADIWDEVADRLKVSNKFREHVRVLVYEHLVPVNWWREKFMIKH